MSVKNVTPKFQTTQNDTVLNIYHANKGEGIAKHTHLYSHLTMCFAGSCVIRKQNIEVVVSKDDQPINLIGEEWHEIEALEDGTIFINVFAEGKLLNEAKI